MTPDSLDDMQSTCNYLAAQLQLTSLDCNRSRWVRDQVVKMLRTPDHVEYYARKYKKEYPYADVRNPYLVDALKELDKD